MKKTSFIYPLFLSLVLVTGIAFFRNVSSFVHAQTSSTTCPNNFTITQPVTNTVLPLQTPVYLSAATTTSSTYTKTISAVQFLVDSKILARGVAAGTNNYAWTTTWYTPVSGGGQKNLQARILFSDNTTCVTSALPVTTLPTTASATLVGTVAPQMWSGSTNVNTMFSMKTGIVMNSQSIDVTSLAAYSWSSTIGSLQQIQNQIKFSSGPSAGSGEIRGVASYGGKEYTVKIPVTVYSQTTSSTSGSSGSSTSSSNPTSNKPTTTPTPTPSPSPSPTPTTPTPTPTPIEALTPSSQLATDESLKTCLLAILSEEKLTLINENKVRPTSEEFTKLRACFTLNNFVIPSNFSPIVPTEVKEKTVTTDVAVEHAYNEERKSSDPETQPTKALVLKGKASPNSTVIIYVFSEPLVLTTVAADDGTWSYSLEDPLEPGNHEAYAMVDKGDGNYQRSSPLDFVIGTAEASAVNPKGYSLNLSKVTSTAIQNNGSNARYIAAIMGLMTVVFAVFFGIVLKKSHPHQPPSHQPRDDSFQTPSITDRPNNPQS